MIQRQLTSEALNSAQMLEVCVLRHGRGEAHIPKGKALSSVYPWEDQMHPEVAQAQMPLLPSLLAFLPPIWDGLASWVQIPPACPTTLISDPAHFQGVPLYSCPSPLHALISLQRLREVSDSFKVTTQQINGRAKI